MSTGKLLLGIAGGIGAGLVIGILFAPDKGSETRRKIAQKKGDISDAVKDKFDSFVDSVSNKFNTAKEEASNLVEKAREMDITGNKAEANHKLEKPAQS